MAQFDVLRNGGRNDERIPLLLDVQSDFLSGLATRMVIPLVTRDHLTPASSLNPGFFTGDREVFLSAQELFSVPVAVLGRSPVVSLAAERDSVVRAMDILITGF